MMQKRVTDGAAVASQERWVGEHLEQEGHVGGDAADPNLLERPDEPRDDVAVPAEECEGANRTTQHSTAQQHSTA
jgi:hypothetical protein